MEQILRVVKELKGQMEVESKEGEGTEFRIRFKKVESPKWFADKIEIKKGSTVVVLDDDKVSQEIWKEKFKGYEDELEVKRFTDVVEAINYLNTMGDKEKEKVLLLTAYKFKGQDINGIVVIEKTNMYDKHILVTSRYLSEIKEFKEKSAFLKICHKICLNEIPFAVV
jgi:hypothetical protein